MDGLTRRRQSDLVVALVMLAGAVLAGGGVMWATYGAWPDLAVVACSDAAAFAGAFLAGGLYVRP